MPGSSISIQVRDGRFDAYLAVPESGQGPGIVLLQEIFGVNANMRAVADLYAEEGYTVLVPDLFWRIAPGVELGWSDADMQRAFALYEKFDVAASLPDIRATVDALLMLAVSGFWSPRLLNLVPPALTVATCWAIAASSDLSLPVATVLAAAVGLAVLGATLRFSSVAYNLFADMMPRRLRPFLPGRAG